MTDREVSDFSMSRVECPKCKAVWLNGKHVWSGTGRDGNALDLAGLVCNNYGDSTCVNPMRGKDGGDTWDARYGKLNKLNETIENELRT